MKPWEKSEILAAKLLGHRVVRGSGRGVQKSDNISDDRRGEHKFTSKKSFRITRQHLQKITKEALLTGREPVFTVQVGKHVYECAPYYGEDLPDHIGNSYLLTDRDSIIIEIGRTWKISRLQ